MLPAGSDRGPASFGMCLPALCPAPIRSPFASFKSSFLRRTIPKPVYQAQTTTAAIPGPKVNR